MQKYNKFWMALAGTLAVGALEGGVIDPGQYDAILTTAASLLTAFGVYAVPNKN